MMTILETTLLIYIFHEWRMLEKGIAILYLRMKNDEL